MFDKIAVKDKPTPQFEGPTEISPVYKFLKSALPGEIPWNCALLHRSGAEAERARQRAAIDACVRESVGFLVFVIGSDCWCCGFDLPQTPSSSLTATASRASGTGLPIRWSRGWCVRFVNFIK